MIPEITYLDKDGLVVSRINLEKTAYYEFVAYHPLDLVKLEGKDMSTLQLLVKQQGEKRS